MAILVKKNKISLRDTVKFVPHFIRSLNMLYVVKL